MPPEFRDGVVSVVLPTFNRPKLLIDAAESVWRQSYRPIELLIVVDGSTDSTRETAQQWIAAHAAAPGFEARLLIQPNRGAPTARNHGLIESAGEFLQFLDSDDLLHRDKLALQTACLRSNPRIAYVWSGHRRLADLSLADVEAPLDDAAGAAVIVAGAKLRRVPTKAVTGLFRRQLCVQMGPWDEGLVRHQDWEYMMRALHHIDAACYQPGALYLIRLHADGRITDAQRSRRKAMLAKLRSAQAAEAFSRQTPCGRPKTFWLRRRLASRYFSILQQSLAARSWDVASQAASGIVRQWWRRAERRAA